MLGSGLGSGFGSGGSRRCRAQSRRPRRLASGRLGQTGRMANPTPGPRGSQRTLQLEYPQVFGTSATLFPTLSFSHDVSGYSIDSQIVEGRQTIGLGLRANFNRVHNIELGYVRYADGAKYDAFRDRDYYSLVLSTSF